MWTENEAFQEDLERLAKMDCIPWDVLTGKRILVTGATGLIGYTLASALLYYDKTRNAHIQVIALVRDVRRAQKKFEAQLMEGCNLELLQGTVELPQKIHGEIDYVIHGASPTASAYFVEKPVETIMTTIIGTKNMLDLAREKSTAGFVYLSSMEVYGEVLSPAAQKEEDLGHIDLFSPRSSYPEGKRMAENLCYAYTREYGVPVTVARLAQTFGPGADRNDGRVFAYAARCALAGEDICLKTSGTKENMYLYTADAASALLLLLAKGERGTAYNVGNPASYCSVKEMAEIAVQALGNGSVSVLINTAIEAETAGLYRPEGHLKLDTQKLEKLGWKETVGLAEMFRRMRAGFEE